MSVAIIFYLHRNLFCPRANSDAVIPTHYTAYNKKIIQQFLKYKKH